MQQVQQNGDNCLFFFWVIFQFNWVVQIDFVDYFVLLNFGVSYYYVNLYEKSVNVIFVVNWIQLQDMIVFFNLVDVYFVMNKCVEVKSWYEKGICINLIKLGDYE